MFAGLVWLCCAQAAAPDPMLARIRAHMVEVLVSMPNYTCQQTVHRSARAASKRRFQSVDTLRLEVSFVKGQELYAWPGADRFEDKPLEEMLAGQGAIGTGAFAMYAETIFRTRAPLFTFQGEEVENGRRLLHYNYRVPQSRSKFIVKAGGVEAAVGYHGYFLVDAASLDLVRLQVDAEEIPARIRVTRCGSVVEYGRRRIGESEFLLPVSAEMTMVDDAGNEHVNRTRFDQCRQYAGASVVHFGEPSTPAAPEPARPVETAPLPAGLNVELNIAAPLDAAGAAIGDPVKAVSAGELKKDGVVLVPKGAEFTGHITRLEQRHAQGIGKYAVVGIRFDAARFGNLRTAFHGRLEEVTYGGNLYCVPFAAGRTPWAPRWAPAMRQPLLAPLAGEGLFFVGGSLRVPARTRMLWRTGP